MVQESIHLDSLETPVGPLLIGATDSAVCLLEFSEPGRERQLESLEKRYGKVVSPGTSGMLSALRAQLIEYFASGRKTFDLPLNYGGTQFQHTVWNKLREIPYGQTWSYGELAERIGDRDATRAVGAANGMNPIAILIPCHRVINANGKLGGFGGGLWRKQILLDLEQGQLQLRL